jgi:hypothetical protein
MEHARELRRKAQQFRRLAAVRTQGGTVDDRILIDLAGRFDEEAEAREERLRSQRAN